MKYLMALLLACPLAAAEPAVAKSTAPVTFASEAARRTGTPGKDVEDLLRRGFGKTEALTFIAIAKAAPKKNWDDLVKERQQGTPLRDLAGETTLDYNKVFEDARALRDAIERTLEKAPTSGQN